MGKKNQLYFKWIRILPNPDNPKEYYLVFQKDREMDRKYIRQFDNMFSGKDVILTIGVLVRHKNDSGYNSEEFKPESKEEEPKKKKKKTEDDEEAPQSPFWEVQG